MHLLFVTSTTSGPARRMESVLASFQVRHRDRVEIRRIEAGADDELVERLGIHHVPALVFVDEERTRTVFEGRTTLEQLERALDSQTTTRRRSGREPRR